MTTAERYQFRGLEWAAKYGRLDINALVNQPDLRGKCVFFLGPPGTGKTCRCAEFVSARCQKMLESGRTPEILPEMITFIGFEDIQRAAKILGQTPPEVTLADRSFDQYTNESKLLKKAINLALERNYEVIIETPGVINRGDLAVREFLKESKHFAFFFLGDQEIVHEAFVRRLDFQISQATTPEMKAAILAERGEALSGDIKDLYLGGGSGTDFQLFYHRFNHYLFLFFQVVLRSFGLVSEPTFNFHIREYVFDLSHHYYTDTDPSQLRSALLAVTYQEIEEIEKKLNVFCSYYPSPTSLMSVTNKNRFMREIFIPFYFSDMGALPDNVGIYTNKPYSGRKTPPYTFLSQLNFIRTLEQNGELHLLLE